jgi:hypothetical protein
MKILFVDQFSDFGGAQLCLRDVFCEVRRRGWGGAVLAPTDGPLLDFATQCGFAAGRLPLSHYTNGRKSAQDFVKFGFDIVRGSRLVRRILRDRAVDLIYVNGPRLLPMVSPADVPLLFHSHSLLDKNYARAAAHWSLRKQKAVVVACSQFTARPRRSRGGPLRVGIIGRIAPEKGQIDFLRAARLIADPRRFHFAVIGAALFSHPGYERAVRAAGEAAGIEFRGWTDNVSNALHDLDVLAVPSAMGEASPRIILEAFSAGTPVIAYTAGGIPEVVRDGHNGWLTDAPCSKSLACAIELLAADRALRLRLAENARRDWESRFSVQRFQREVCDLIHSTVISPAHAATEAPGESPALRSGSDEALSSP